MIIYKSYLRTIQSSKIQTTQRTWPTSHSSAHVRCFASVTRCHPLPSLASLQRSSAVVASGAATLCTHTLHLCRTMNGPMLSSCDDRAVVYTVLRVRRLPSTIAQRGVVLAVYVYQAGLILKGRYLLRVRIATLPAYRIG